MIRDVSRPFIVTIVVLIITPLIQASAEPATRRDPKWVSCLTAQDCVVIDVGGCLATEVVNKRYEKEFRDWSRVENLRIECYRDPKITPLPMEALVVSCANNICVASVDPRYSSSIGNEREYPLVVNKGRAPYTVSTR